MNIVYFKLGKAIFFNKEKWSSIGGDVDAPSLLLRLAQQHPEDKFYLCTSNDLSKNPQIQQRFPNIIDMYSGFNVKYDSYDYLYNKFKRMNIQIDYALVMNGITGGLHYTDKDVLRRDGTITPNKTLMFMKLYCCNQIHLLNESKCRWSLISPDPRYVPLAAYDIYNKPELNFAEYEFEFDWICRNYDSLEKYSLGKVQSTYNKIDTMCLMSKPYIQLSNYLKPRSQKINIVLNEGGGHGATPRGDKLTEYVLNQFSDVSIYGKWSDEYMKDDRFKGPMYVDKIAKLLADTKYTFIIPTDDDWLSTKFCEMAYYGILPFMHPTYDTQKHIKCNEFLRVNSPEELKNRIEYLESNEEFRLELVRELHEMYGKEYHDGSYVVEQIYNQINKK